MRIILSRKGFDASAGGVPSPILPDGRLISLPISRPEATATYSELSSAGYDLGQLVADLTGNAAAARQPAHLDPDLFPEARPRMPGWRPIFGQTDAAQKHLETHGVGEGDLFLFFGWFRRVEKRDGRFRYMRGAPDLHLLFGWLEVGEVIRLPHEQNAIFPWAADHPHFAFDVGSRNTAYVAKRFRTSGSTLGGGAFRRFHPELVLTAPGQPRSLWRLPEWFWKEGQSPALTYHSDPKRWSRTDGGVLLRSAGRGQEFVLDTATYPEALGWATTLVRISDADRVAERFIWKPSDLTVFRNGRQIYP